MYAMRSATVTSRSTSSVLNGAIGHRQDLPSVPRSLRLPVRSVLPTPSRLLRFAVRAERDTGKRGGNSMTNLRGLPDAPVDQNAPYTAGPAAKFSIPRERWAGRIACIGMFSAAIGEVLTARGPAGQLNLETGLPVGLIQALIGASIVFVAITSLAPGSPTWNPDNQAQVDARGRKSARELDEGGYPLSLVNGGLNSTNEVNVGRIAMLSFFFAYLYEIFTGAAPLRDLLPFAWQGVPGPTSLLGGPWWVYPTAGLFLLFGIGGPLGLIKKTDVM